MSNSRAASPCATRVGDDQGVALIIVLMVMTLIMALGLALLLTTNTETRIAGNYREANEALYAADAAVERAIADIFLVPSWDDLLTGSVTSAFIDGAPGGVRTLPDGSLLNLTEATSIVRCGKSACSSADLVAVTEERPWGANNPVWQLYAYGPIDQLVPGGTVNSRVYVAVWVADDPSESDGDPLRDGAPPAGCNPGSDAACGVGNIGRGVISMLAKAFGPDGTQRAIEVTLSRRDVELERGYAGEGGQDEQNRRSRRAPVQTPGKALTQTIWSLSNGGT